jgi:hypothetical protein
MLGEVEPKYWSLSKDRDLGRSNMYIKEVSRLG